MLVRRLLTYASYAARRLALQALNFPLFRKETWSVVKGQILRYAFGYNGEVVACHAIVFVLVVSVFAALFGCFRLPRVLHSYNHAPYSPNENISKIICKYSCSQDKSNCRF